MNYDFINRKDNTQIAETLNHNNGTNDIIIARTNREKKEEFEKMLEERLGSDAAKMFREIVTTAEEGF